MSFLCLSALCFCSTCREWTEEVLLFKFFVHLVNFSIFHCSKTGFQCIFDFFCSPVRGCTLLFCLSESITWVRKNLPWINRIPPLSSHLRGKQNLSRLTEQEWCMGSLSSVLCVSEWLQCICYLSSKVNHMHEGN